MRPKIGVTTGQIPSAEETWSPTIDGQSRTYSHAVTNAGGLPFLIPHTRNLDVINQSFDSFDGFLFAGGNDVQAKLYGQRPYQNHEKYSKDRDNQEIILLKRALEEGKPILAICRGLQLLNVLLEGNLHQHIATDLPEANDHSISSKKKDIYDIAHRLKLDPPSRLATIVGKDYIEANSHHHQAIKSLALKLKAVGWSEDGIIEAVEMPDHKFCIGVQCHPESLVPDTVPEWARLFEAFVQTAR